MSMKSSKVEHAHKTVNLWHINNTSMKLFRKKEERKSALKKDDVCQSHTGTN